MKLEEIEIDEQGKAVLKYILLTYKTEISSTVSTNTNILQSVNKNSLSSGNGTLTNRAGQLVAFSQSST